MSVAAEMPTTNDSPRAAAAVTEVDLLLSSLCFDHPTASPPAPSNARPPQADAPLPSAVPTRCAADVSSWHLILWQ